MLFAAFDPTASIAAICGVISVGIGAWVAVRLKRLELEAQAAREAAERAAKLVATLRTEFTWITKGGPEW